MSDNLEQYKALMTDIIAKQSVILGPDISKLKARSVEGLVVSEDGKVTDINGDAAGILQKLVDQYVSLAGEIVKNALGSVFEKYPSIQRVQ